jgi:hypothetical protein
VAFQFKIKLFVTIVHLVVFGTFEKGPFDKKDMKDSPEREHVTDGLNVCAFSHLDNFWCNVPGSATPKEEILLKIRVAG